MAYLTYAAPNAEFSSVNPKVSSFTPGTYSDTIVVIFCGMGSTHSSQTLNSATYDGVSMTKGTMYKDSNNNDFGCFYIEGVTGAGNINVTGSNTDQKIKVIAIAYSGVTGGVSGITGNTGLGNTTAPTITITSASGSTCLSFGHSSNSGQRVTTSYTERYDGDQIGTGSSYVIERAGSASTVIDASSSSNPWYTYGISLDVTGGGGGSAIAAISNHYRMMRSA